MRGCSPKDASNSIRSDVGYCSPNKSGPYCGWLRNLCAPRHETMVETISLVFTGESSFQRLSGSAKWISSIYRMKWLARKHEGHKTRACKKTAENRVEECETSSRLPSSCSWSRSMPTHTRNVCERSIAMEIDYKSRPSIHDMGSTTSSSSQITCTCSR